MDSSEMGRYGDEVKGILGCVGEWCLVFMVSAAVEGYVDL